MLNYQDKVCGCWIGKCLGGAIGMAYEGVPYQPELTENDIVVQHVPNDDLELQLIWLMALRKHGLGLDHRKLGEIWLEHIPHGLDEYAIALRNLKRGIMPPASGWKDNFFADGMGAAIRSEIWAAVFAGRPDAAGYFASLDASVDHWGDGVRAEVYMAVAECFAFEDTDHVRPLKQALESLPECRLAKVLKEVHALYDARIPAEEARDVILRDCRNHNFTDCVMNLANATFALLWGGGDFLQTILLAVNMGRDTDCTAATAGAYLGIARGSEVIPEKWRNRVNDRLALSDFILAIPGIPRTLSGTVDMTLELHDALRMPEAKYPQYEPYVSDGSEPSFDRSRWLILDEEECNVSELEKELIRTGRCPQAFASKVGAFNDLTMNLERYAKNGGNLHLFSILDVENDDTKPEEVFVSASADTGLTLWMDGVKLFDQFSRALMIPSFHRVEGGMCFHYPLKKGDRRVVHLRLYSCVKPLRCTLMFGNGFRDHLEGFHLNI